jgi:hypothetical protein
VVALSLCSSTHCIVPSDLWCHPYDRLLTCVLTSLFCCLLSFCKRITELWLGPGSRPSQLPLTPWRSSVPLPARTAMRSVIRTGALRCVVPYSASPRPHSGPSILRVRTTQQPPVPTHPYFHSKSRDASEALGTAARLPDAEPVPPVRPRERITIADIKERRDKAGRLIAPTASYSDADMFKAPVRRP